MGEYWKSQDLDGNGLQTINQLYSQLKLNLRTAYLLGVFFPFGAQQFYLGNTKLGFVYLLLSLLAGISLFFSTTLFILFLLLEFGLLIYDVIKLDERVIRFNKILKMNLSLQTDSEPPKNYRGRYTEDTPIDDYFKVKESEITTFESSRAKTNHSRIYSFAEQEEMLKEITRNKERK